MASVITVMNMKGGVGKTTVAAHLAGMLAIYKFGEKRRKVIVIDYDAQFNLSQMFIPPDEYVKLDKARKTSHAILQDDEGELNPYVLQVPGNRTPPRVKDVARPIYTANSDGGILDIVPSTMDLMYVALGTTRARTDPIEERFDKFVKECRSLYDVVIVDCHPAGSILTRTALKCSDHVIIPVAPSPFAARGISLMMQFVGAVKAGSAGAVLHVLFNMEGRTPSESQVGIRGNPHFAKYCIGPALRWYKAFTDPVGGQHFVWHSKRPHSTQAWQLLRTVVDAIVTRTCC